MTGFNIREFLSSVTPPLKASKFLFRVSAIPPGLVPSANSPNTAVKVSTWTNTQKSLSFYAETVDLPGLALMTNNIYRYGYGAVERKPYAPMYTDLRVLFRGDQDGEVWNFMRSWTGVAVNYQMSTKDTMSATTGFGRNGGIVNGTPTRATPYEVAYKSDYAIPVEIEVMNDKGDVVQQIILADAYPYALDPIPFSWEAKSSYAQFPVRFAYSKYAISGVNPT